LVCLSLYKVVGAGAKQCSCGLHLLLYTRLGGGTVGS
jgi:hypothetical protein